MYLAWDNGKWTPLEEEHVEIAESRGYQVIEVPEGTVIYPEWLQPGHEPGRIERWVDYGMLQLDEYLRLVSP